MNTIRGREGREKEKRKQVGKSSKKNNEKSGKKAAKSAGATPLLEIDRSTEATTAPAPAPAKAKEWAPTRTGHLAVGARETGEPCQPDLHYEYGSISP